MAKDGVVTGASCDDVIVAIGGRVWHRHLQITDPDGVVASGRINVVIVDFNGRYWTGDRDLNETGLRICAACATGIHNGRCGSGAVHVGGRGDGCGIAHGNRDRNLHAVFVIGGDDQLIDELSVKFIDIKDTECDVFKVCECICEGRVFEIDRQGRCVRACAGGTTKNLDRGIVVTVVKIIQCVGGFHRRGGEVFFG